MKSTISFMAVTAVAGDTFRATHRSTVSTNLAPEAGNANLPAKFEELNVLNAQFEEQLLFRVEELSSQFKDLKSEFDFGKKAKEVFEELNNARFSSQFAQLNKTIVDWNTRWQATVHQLQGTVDAVQSKTDALAEVTPSDDTVLKVRSALANLALAEATPSDEVV